MINKIAKLLCICLILMNCNIVFAEGIIHQEKNYINGEIRNIQSIKKLSENREVTTSSAYSISSGAYLEIDGGDPFDMSWEVSNGNLVVKEMILDVSVWNNGPEDLKGGFKIEVHVDVMSCYTFTFPEDLPSDSGYNVGLVLKGLEAIEDQIFDVVIYPLNKAYMPEGYEGGYNIYDYDFPDGYHFRTIINLRPDDTYGTEILVKDVKVKNSGRFIDEDGQIYADEMQLILELYNNGEMPLDGFWIRGETSIDDYDEVVVTRVLDVGQTIEVPLTFYCQSIDVNKLYLYMDTENGINITAPRSVTFNAKGIDMSLKTEGVESITWGSKDDVVCVEKLTVPVTVSNVGLQDVEGYQIHVKTNIDNHQEYWFDISEEIKYGKANIPLIEIPNLSRDVTKLYVTAYPIGDIKELDMRDNTITIPVNLNNEKAIKMTYQEPHDIVWEEKDGISYAKQLVIDGTITNTSMAVMTEDVTLKVRRKVNGIWNETDIQSFEVNDDLAVRSSVEVSLTLDWVHVDTEAIEVAAYNKQNALLGEKYNLPVQLFMVPEGKQVDQDNKVIYQKLPNGRYICFEYDLNGNLLRRRIR